jgi:hypothetical protein
MFGLAAVAAVAAMAFVGASSAMATSTALCTEDSAGATCPAGKLASHVHYVATGALLLNPILTISCTALFLGNVSNPTLLGAPLVINGNLTYSSCTVGCTVTEVSAGATIEALKTGAEEAKITGSGEVEVFCAGVLECTYNGTGLAGEGKGPLVTGDNGHVTFTNQKVEKTGGPLCPQEAKLDALFIALPSPLYLRE